MKALSLIQPWASLILDGRKTIETRTWHTNYRGPLLICASKTCTGPDREQAWQFGYDPVLLPRGVAICIAELIDCERFEARHSAAAMVEFIPDERRFAWILEKVRPVEQLEVKGARGLFDVTDELLERLGIGRLAEGGAR